MEIKFYKEKKMSEEKVLLEEGRLTRSGKRYEIVQSAQSAVSEGQHVVITVLDEDGRIFDHKELYGDEKENALGVLIEFLQGEQPDGRWVIGLNGDGVTVRKTFHPHGIISKKKGQVLRLIFNGREFLNNLRAARNMDNVKILADEFEANLK